MFSSFKTAWLLSSRAAKFYKTSTISRFLKLFKLRICYKFRTSETAFNGMLDPNYKITKDSIWSFTYIEAEMSKLSPASEIGNVDNKLLFANHCLHKNLRTPKVCGYIETSGKLVKLDHGEKHEVDSASFIETLPEEFVTKPQFGMGGHSVFMFKKEGSNIRNTTLGSLSLDEFIEHLKVTYSKVSGIFQKRENNHSVLGDLLDTQTLGTVRIVTLISKDGSPKIISAFLKFPGKDMEVDNFGIGASGQLIAEVDFDTGILDTGVGTHSSGFGMIFEESHPLTKNRIKGAALPLWPETMKLAMNASRAFPSLRAIGWDISITPEGPIIIEGNSRWGVPSLHKSINKIRDELVTANNE